MARIVRRPRARDDLIEIWSYIAGDNEAAADGVLDRIDGAFTILADNPGPAASVPNWPAGCAASPSATTCCSISSKAAGSIWCVS